ncbi:hypothetical protein DPMN_039245 [Dreissena polymorpha]|uniref:Uncharacterized protein n=1 Tax=Dreissena polymorpha TaxID=45954 RepID=A0A9D4MII9_DREPO|nr:hypothetical protein DPMN_039245 [Dreissena polymorpha]
MVPRNTWYLFHGSTLTTHCNSQLGTRQQLPVTDLCLSHSSEELLAATLCSRGTMGIAAAEMRETNNKTCG